MFELLKFVKSKKVNRFQLGFETAIIIFLTYTLTTLLFKYIDKYNLN